MIGEVLSIIFKGLGLIIGGFIGYALFRKYIFDNHKDIGILK